MIIYSIMFIYIFLIGVFWKSYCTNNSVVVKSSSNVSLSIAVLILILPVFFIGMRTNYVDTSSYISGFNSLSMNLSEALEDVPWDKGSGWIVYEWIIKRFITRNANAFLMITAIIHAGALLKLYYKYSTDYCYSMLLFFLSCSFVNMMNGIRQFTALCLILYFIDWVFEKKYIPFLIVVSIAVTIHFSAIIWIPAVFLVQGKTWNWKMIAVSIIAVLALMFLENFTDILSDTLEDTSYSGYTTQFADDDGSNIMHTVLAFIPVLFSFIGRKIIDSEDDGKVNVMVNISLLGAIISLFGNFTSGILVGRMPIYFTIFNFALYPWMFEKIFTSSKQVFRFLCLLGYCAYAIYYMTHSWGSAGMPYISDVLGINTWS